MVRPFRPFLICAAAALLSACGAAGGTPVHEPAGFRAAAGPVHLIQDLGPSPGRQEGVQGVLRLDGNGCLRIGPTDAMVLVWPNTAALDLTEPGVVRIYDRARGASVTVGQRVALGGASRTNWKPVLNRPTAPCAGELWDMDSFAPDPTAPTR